MSKDKILNSMSALNLSAKNFSVGSLTVSSVTVDNLTATNGTITNLTSTTGNITNVISTNVDTENLTTESLRFTPSETLTSSSTASALVTTTYIDTSGGGAGQIFEIVLPTPLTSILKIIILRDGPGILDISGTGLSEDVIVTIPNEGAVFMWNNDVSMWNVVSGPLTNFSTTFSGTIIVDPAATPGPTTFNTITAALDSFRGEVVTSCIINVAADTYVEDIDIDGIFVCNNDSLSIIGDEREIVGLSYVEDAPGNGGNVTNGGSGIVSFTGWGTDTLTVDMDTDTPDFDAAGIVTGDRILFSYPPTPTVTLFTIASILDNAITITGTFPADPGEPGSTLTLLPNRILSGFVNIKQNAVFIQGFEIHTTAAPNHSLKAERRGFISFNNIVCREGALIATDLGAMNLMGASFSVINVTAGEGIGLLAENGGYISCNNSVVAACLEGGYYTRNNSALRSINMVCALILGGGLNSAAIISEAGSFPFLNGHLSNCRNGYYVTNLSDTRIRANITANNIERRVCFIENCSEILTENISITNCAANQAFVEVTNGSDTNFGQLNIFGTVFPANGLRVSGCSEILSGGSQNFPLSAAAVVMDASSSRIISVGLINATGGGGAYLSFARAVKGSIINRGSTSLTLTTTDPTLFADGRSTISLAINSATQATTWIEASAGSYVDLITGGGSTVPPAVGGTSLDSFSTLNSTGIATPNIAPAAAQNAIVIDNTAIPGFLGAGAKL